VAKALEKRAVNYPTTRANQWDVQLAASGTTLLAAWLDHRSGDWELLASYSRDSGLSWSMPIRVDGASAAAGASSPVLARDGPSMFVVAWEDSNPQRTSAGVVARRLELEDEGDLVAGALVELGDDANWRAWSGAPGISFDLLGRAIITFTEHDQASTTLMSARWDEDKERFVVEELLAAREQVISGKFHPVVVPVIEGNALERVVLYEKVLPGEDGSSIIRLVKP